MYLHLLFLKLYVNLMEYWLNTHTCRVGVGGAVLDVVGVVTGKALVPFPPVGVDVAGGVGDESSPPPLATISTTELIDISRSANKHRYMNALSLHPNEDILIRRTMSAIPLHWTRGWD